MRRLPRCEYTLGFKLEAVQRAGERGIYSAARELGLAEQTLRNWVKAQREQGGLTEARPVTKQQMEESRQRAAEARRRLRAQWRLSPPPPNTAATMPA